MRCDCSRRPVPARRRALSCSQPTLSAQIAKLEDELGLRLFQRGPRTPTPTVEGRAIIPRRKSYWTRGTVGARSKPQGSSIDGGPDRSLRRSCLCRSMATICTGILCSASRSSKLYRAARRACYAARRRSSADQTIASARTRSSISASLCSGEGVRRSRSVPRGTVG